MVQRQKTSSQVFFRIIADMTSPIALSPFFFAYVCLRFISDPVQALKVFVVCFIAYSLLPLFYLMGAYKAGTIPDMHLYKKEERNKVFPAISVFYLLGLIMLYKMSAPALILGLAFSSTALILIIWWINLYHKISIHMSGIAGMLVGIYFIFGKSSGANFMPFLPIAGWIRYKSKAHSLSELTTGAVAGTAVTWFILAFLFS